MSNIVTGKQGEEEAVTFLQTLGYVILERNYKVGRYEADIIARDNNKLVFVEVKTLKDKGLPEVRVDEAKQKRMVSIARTYCASIKHEESIRFDIVSVVLLKFGKRIMHFPDVFYPMETGI